jgi:UDP-N-acetyl-D-mannosaminuronate dehydrogenase
MQFNKVLVVGLGQLGLPAAKYIKEKGFEVYGFDSSIKAIERAERTIAIKRAADLGDFDVYIICISTHAPEDISTPKIEGVLSIAERISKDAKKDGALVAIESTIPKGTSQKVFELLSHRLHVVHAPHRWYALEEREHGVNQLRVIGGVCDCCLKAGLQFYSETASYFNTGSTSSLGTDTPTLSHDCKMSKHNNLGIPMHPVSAVEIAETTKIVENANRYLQIAFAEELYLYCQANNLSFPELRDALNTKWNVNILEPREGIGGHCKQTKTIVRIEPD